jgi:hypothetical protein
MAKPSAARRKVAEKQSVRVIDTSIGVAWLAAVRPRDGSSPRK